MVTRVTWLASSGNVAPLDARDPAYAECAAGPGTKVEDACPHERPGIGDRDGDAGPVRAGETDLDAVPAAQLGGGGVEVPVRHGELRSRQAAAAGHVSAEEAVTDAVCARRD